MAIFDFIFRRKIKLVHYFDENTKVLDLPNVKAQLLLLKSEGEIDFKIGKKQIHSKITIPEGGDTTKLLHLDQLQYTLASAINTLKGKSKQEKTEKYVDSLFEILKLVSLDSSTSEGKKKNLNENNAINVNFKQLNKYLGDRGFQSNGLPSNLSTTNGFVIWPIALQPSATYIHTAQIQLINLLVQAGWRLHIIIGDCGKHSSTIKSPNNFKNSISDLLKKNQIDVTEKTVTLLSRYFKRKPDDRDATLIEEVTSLDLLNTFHNISDSILWYDYFSYITKNYNKTKKNEITKNRKVLNNLQPLLNWTVVTTISNAKQIQQSKVIVIAGEDERKQWDEVIKSHGNNNIGLIYIHELKLQNKTMDQSEINIGSETDMLKKLEYGNMGQWLYTHFVELPKFLNNTKPSFCRISDNICTANNNNCIKCLFEGDKNFNNPDFNKRDFVSSIYEIANPA